MDKDKIISPDVGGRKPISFHDLKKGDVVAFATVYKDRLRTGLMVLSSDTENWFLWAVNLYEDDGYEYVCDHISSIEDIIFFEATTEEKVYALQRAISHFTT